MKHILLCDDGEPEDVVSIARRYTVGVEFQAFYKPEVLDDPGQTLADHRQYTDFAWKGLHGAFGDLCPGSFDPLVREVTRKRVLQSLDVASQLGVCDVVFHHGYVPNTYSSESWVKRSSDFWRSILGQTSERVKLYLENVLDDTPSVIKRLVDEVDSPRLSVCFDMGHVHAFSETSTSEWIETLGSRIRYVHIHDNNGKEDEHLAIGKGSIPMRGVLDALESQSRDAIWGLEVLRGDLLQSFRWIEENYGIGV